MAALEQVRPRYHHQSRRVEKGGRQYFLHSHFVASQKLKSIVADATAKIPSIRPAPVAVSNISALTISPCDRAQVQATNPFYLGAEGSDLLMSASTLFEKAVDLFCTALACLQISI